MYRMESVQVNDSLKKYLDSFQLNVYRSILGLKHTYIDRQNTNEKIMEDTETALNAHNRGAHIKISKLSEYYEQQKLTTVAYLLHHKARGTKE